MSVATLLSTRQLIIIQACVQSVLVVTLASAAAEGFSRWLDAVVGCALALLVATVAPGAPLRKPAQLAAKVLEHLASTLEAAATELRESDTQAGDEVLAQARRAEEALAELSDATAEGLAVVRQSPFRRRQLAGDRGVRPAVRPAGPRQPQPPGAGPALRGRPVARRGGAGRVPGPDDRAGRGDALHGHRAPERAAAHRARDRLVAIGQATSHLELSESISAVVILAQVRSITADLLELTGMDYAEARDSDPGDGLVRPGLDLRSAGGSPMVGHCRRGVEQLGSSLGS